MGGPPSISSLSHRPIGRRDFRHGRPRQHVDQLLSKKRGEPKNIGPDKASDHGNLGTPLTDRRVAETTTNPQIHHI